MAEAQKTTCRSPALKRWRASAGHGVFTLALVAMLLPAGACASLPPAERQVLIDAYGQYNRGDINAAGSGLDRIVREYGNASEIAEVYYLRGLCRFISEQPQAASEDFERGVSSSGRADLTARCQASLAAIAFQAGDWDRAAELYDLSTGELPDVPPTEAVLYAAGVSMQRAGQWQKAAFQFGRILNQFRDNPIAADARRMAAWRHPWFSIQLGAYRDADTAGRSVQSLRQQGFDAFQEYMPQEGQSAWVVMAGRYAKYTDAQAAMEHVRRRQPNAAIIP